MIAERGEPTTPCKLSYRPVHIASLPFPASPVVASNSRTSICVTGSCQADESCANKRD